jgi:hypothetical protein
LGIPVCIYFQVSNIYLSRFIHFSNRHHWVSLWDLWHFQLVFKGPVAWTGKKTETEPNPTEGNWTVSCGCFIWESVWLQVASLWKYSKTDQRPVAIGCDRSFHCIFYVMYIQLKLHKYR